MTSTTPAFDTIIVGAGTAGCLLANRLSADPNRRVLLIEAGGKDDYIWIHVPVGYLYCIGNPRTDWCFMTEPEPGLNGRVLRYPRGKTLGGCSSINGMIYMRGQARDYRQWSEITGEDDWDWDQVLPFFKRHEDHHKGGDDAHAAGGEWRVERQRLRWDILDAWAAAAEQAGLPATTDFNRGDNEGVGYFEVNQKNGWRWNAAKAFLRPAMARPNLTVWTKTQVARLITTPDEDGLMRCTGVEVVRNGERMQALARQEVVLSAGAVGSPQILQVSGIGPAALLNRHGIEVRHDLPGVGANLQDHLQIRAVYKVKGTRTLNRLASNLVGKATIGLEYALRRTGPMSMAPSQLGAFTRSSAEKNAANIQFHVQPLSLDAFGEPLHSFDAFTASVCNLNPTSRGTISIRSPNFEDAPLIAPNYLSTEEDRKVAADSLRVTRRICGQKALEKFQPEEWKPGAQYETDEQLAKLAGDIASTIFHPVGTTRMGRADDPDAVLDPHFRVRGMRGLRVVDAGAMPTITSGNTNSPTLMMAEKAAAWILAGM
ncbi:GMC family oxidoreductase N-terminal domain-containing protein (plasmid) [Tistrella bauzanensis]|uniref:GMC family oxidoreductase n=1 Tax=Tistrella TaxID=171436 RepID=UPI0031F5FDF3